MVWFLTLLNILNYLDRYLVAAVLPLLIAEYQLTNEEGGRLVSAFVIGYILFSPIFRFLGDRHHRPRLMSLGVVLWSLATIASGFAPTFLAFLLARICVGVGEASFVSISPGFLKDRLQDPVKLNSSLSIFFAAIPVGSALGYVLGGTLSQMYDWHFAFLCCGIPGLLLAPILLKIADAPRTEVSEPQPFLQGFVEISKVPHLRYAIAGYVLNSFALNGIAAFIVKHGMTIGFSIDSITRYFGLILVVAGFVGTLAGGALCSRLVKRRNEESGTMFLFVAISAFIAVPLLFMAFVTTDTTLFLVLCFLGELAIFSGVGPINSIIVLSSPGHLVTLTQGVTIFFINLFGAFLAPILVGLVADSSSLTIGLQMSTGALFLCGLTWYLGAQNARDARAT